MVCRLLHDVPEAVKRRSMATSEIQSTKGKSVCSVSLSVPLPTSSVEDEPPDEKKGKTVSHPPARLPSRNASSKYDFVKVKVWLGDNADHYYVLSRFLLSRMLTVTKIPNHVAIKIALELKKLLVDNSLLDVSQSDLEANLFKLMERRNYGEEYINRYKMMTRFHHQRVPLVILVCGTACTGKSTIATQLAQRLNLPNVLQTEMVYELLRTSTDAPLTSTPVWARDFNSPEELITEFCRECRIVRKGLAGDLKKAMKDGKPIIIEDDTENTLTVPETEVTMDERGTSELKDANDSRPTLGADISSESLGDAHKDLKLQIDNTLKPEKSGSEPIIIPIVLKMAEFDHKALLEEWVGTRTFQDKCIVKDQNKLISNLKTIQDYLCSFESQGMTVVNISATTFPQTLDRLHSYLLQCIEQGIPVAASKNGRP
ncbi:P-loop NTPase domain-containing protein LPA1 homolog 1-like isoform X2 [Zingiber officinale]|uniref:P-loop NTPase domain-containing protein LPA1 homolog 1-like isoform X2 n=1 Tax=Zingiber officinale TaxID=94328 RepID=UPI001C4C38EC|nr:P-loop NTPase domain-containing protein LPA1 homolog 1-like isoform X2 [Zingiber officinale]